MQPVRVDLPAQEQFWDHWHRTRGAKGTDRRHKQLRKAFLREMSDVDGAIVLDLGCGQGHDAVTFAGAGMTVTALDFSPVAVEQTRTLARQRRVAVDVERHDLRRPLPFGDNSVDGVYSHLALHYFDDETTRRVFGEISRVLRRDGVLVFSVKSSDDPYHGQGEPLGPDIFCRNGHVRHFFRKPYLEELLAGWKAEIEPRRGRYASRSKSDFFHVTARKLD